MTSLDVALNYASAGVAVIPLPHGRKEPRARFPLRYWLSRQFPPTERELLAMFNGHRGNLAALCGIPSDNLLVLDAETPERFSEHHAKLEAEGIETWAVATARGGHHYLRAQEPVKSKPFGDWEIRGAFTYVLAPPSVHPTGVVYEFVRRSAEIFELPALDALSWLTLEAARIRPNIPSRTRKLLHGGDLVGQLVGAGQRYETRSEYEFAILCGLANAGFGFEDALDFFSAYPAAGKYRKLLEENSRKASHYLRRSWRKAVEFVEANPSPHKTLAQKLEVWTLSRPWPGRTGSSDRATYLAHLEIVQRTGKQPHGASCRELAELSGLGFGTAANSNRRLVKAGLLEVVRSSTSSSATRYRLVDVVGNVAPRHSPYTPPVGDCASRQHSELVRHDAFRFRGLNKAAAEVLTVFLSRPGGVATVSQLVKATGRDRTTVHRKLKGDPKRGHVGLFQLGLVEPVGRGEWRVIPEFRPIMLAQAAAELGTAGALTRQKRRHRRDRATNRQGLDRQR